MRFLRLFAIALTPAALLAEAQLTPQQAEAALNGWFPSTCVNKEVGNPQMSFVLECTPKNGGDGAPILIGAATMEMSDFANQVNAISNAASKKKAKHRKNDWNAILEDRVMRQEQSPRGRVGYYGAHPGINESALSFLVVDTNTRQTLQLMYTHRPVAIGDEPINWKATSKSREKIFEHLKRTGFELEKHYWR